MKISKETKNEIKQMIKKFNDNELDLINSFYKYFAEFKENEIYLKIKRMKKHYRLQD